MLIKFLRKIAQHLFAVWDLQDLQFRFFGFWRHRIFSFFYWTVNTTCFLQIWPARSVRILDWGPVGAETEKDVAVLVDSDCWNWESAPRSTRWLPIVWYSYQISDTTLCLTAQVAKVSINVVPVEIHGFPSRHTSRRWDWPTPLPAPLWASRVTPDPVQ